jgi:hypothetical protein
VFAGWKGRWEEKEGAVVKKGKGRGALGRVLYARKEDNK